MANVCQTPLFLGVIQGAHLLQILIESPLDARVVSEVDCFDLAPIAPFVHDLRLASDSLVLIAAYGHECHFMKPGPGRLQQIENSFLSGGNLFTIEHSINHLVDALAHIGELFADIWSPFLPGLDVAEGKLSVAAGIAHVFLLVFRRDQEHPDWPACVPVLA